MNMNKVINQLASLMISIVAVSLLSSCQTCRITPPPEHLTRSTDLSGKVAADIQQLNAKGELSANWKKNVEEKFTALNDDNAVYFMLLEAIQCQKDKHLAQSMFSTLESEMKARRDARSRARSSRKRSNELPAELKAKRDATIASFQ